MSKDRAHSQFESLGALLPAVVKDKDPLNALVKHETDNADRSLQPSDSDFSNPQLSLFQTFLCNTDEQRNSLSNAIDLWDSVPRYSVSRQAMSKVRLDGRFLEKHVATFQHRGRTYTRTIFPARVTDIDGKDREYYPSANEELIEDALRKIATEQHAGYFSRPDYSSGVMFTLYELREELKKRGHARSYQEIVLGLNVLSSSVILIEAKDTEKGIGFDKSTYFPHLAAVSRQKLQEDPKAKWVVQFHPLVTQSIDQVTYRQYNYHLMMSHSTQLARWVHKQLVLKYTFAEAMKPFDMRYSTVKRDSGLLDGYSRPRAAIEALTEAFSELKNRGVFLGYTRNDVKGPRGKLLDVIFTVIPNVDFVREVKAANKRQGDALKPVGTGGGSSRLGTGSGANSGKNRYDVGRKA